MASFLTYNGVTSSILQPSYIRTRHRFKGQRESAKFNLDAHQFYYDINVLMERAEALQDAQSANLATLYDADEQDLPEGIETLWLGDSPIEIEWVFMDVTTLAAHIDGLARRVNKLSETET